VDQTYGNGILTGIAARLLPATAGVFSVKDLRIFGHGSNFFINYGIQDFLLLTRISKVVVKVVSIHVHTPGSSVGNSGTLGAAHLL
jgi:hypothetical protein